MQENKSYVEGATVKYVDEHGKAHDALVTTWWGLDHYRVAGGEPGVNLVFVSDDVAKHDQYGRQLERRTSVVHKSSQGAPGWYWCWPDE